MFFDAGAHSRASEFELCHRSVQEAVLLCALSTAPPTPFFSSEESAPISAAMRPLATTSMLVYNNDNYRQCAGGKKLAEASEWEQNSASMM